MKKLDFFEKNGYVIIDIDKKFIKKFRSLKKEIEIESRKFSNLYQLLPFSLTILVEIALMKTLLLEKLLPILET